MLKQIHGALDLTETKISIRQAAFPRPFYEGLQFNAPVHGTWNIVHTAMLIPDSHLIFACAINCNRGVVMTAAEMGLMNRFSTITVTEQDMLYKDMEKLLITGTKDILDSMTKKPRMVLFFPSCIHHFLGTDLKYVYETLEKEYPEICFARCFMDPTMQRHSMPPDIRLRREMYAGLTALPKKEKTVSIIGNNIAMSKECDLMKTLSENEFTCYELATLKSYDEYLLQAESRLNLVTHPQGLIAARALEERLAIPYLYIPLCYSYEEIKDSQKRLSLELQLEVADAALKEQQCELALKELKEALKDRPVAIDYTFTPRPLGLARLLLEHGLNVERIYLDVIAKEEEKDFLWLKDKKPELMIYSTIHYAMRTAEKPPKDVFLSLGQKAAYFTDTGYFVNLIEGGGLYGFSGIIKLCELILEAAAEKKDTKELVVKKGLGCECIL